MPGASWKPPARLPGGDRPDGRVQFTEELSGRTLTFDFARFPVAPGIQWWLARALARSTGPRSGVKRSKTAYGHYYALKSFADSLALEQPAVERPDEVTAQHIVAYRARYYSPPRLSEAIRRLRVVLDDDPELPGAARAELCEVRLPERYRPGALTAYSDGDWQVIMTALRHDVRAARDRIRAGQQSLARYRARRNRDR
jgi:hypothetical protein